MYTITVIDRNGFEHVFKKVVDYHVGPTSIHITMVKNKSTYVIDQNVILYNIIPERDED